MDGGTQGMEATSHVTMEVALSTRPNVVLFGEEIAEKRMSLNDIVNRISDVVCARAHQGKNFGTVVIPEGLPAAVPEVRVLLDEISKLPMPCSLEKAFGKLSHFSAALLKSF